MAQSLCVADHGSAFCAENMGDDEHAHVGAAGADGLLMCWLLLWLISRSQAAFGSQLSELLYTMAADGLLN